MSENSEAAFKERKFLHQGESMETWEANDVALAWGGQYMDSSLYLVFKLYIRGFTLFCIHHISQLETGGTTYGCG